MIARTIDPKEPGSAAPFIASEISADFVQDLKDDIKAIRVASAFAVGRLIKSGMAEITQLNAIMRNKYGRNADKLRAWDSASQIERAPQCKKKPAPAPANPAK